MFWFRKALAFAVMAAAILLASCGERNGTADHKETEESGIVLHDGYAEPCDETNDIDEPAITEEAGGNGEVVGFLPFEPIEWEAPEARPALTARDEAWIEDINFFARHMRSHPWLNRPQNPNIMPMVWDVSGSVGNRWWVRAWHESLFNEALLNEFDARIYELLGKVPHLGNHEILFNLLEISALTACGHTAVAVPIKRFPISISWYEDGLYVFAAPAQYPEALFTRLVAINHVPYYEIIDKLRQVVPHYNEYGLLGFHLQRHIMNARLLRHIGVVSHAYNAVYSLVNEQGEEFELFLSAIALEDFRAEHLLTWQQDVIDVALRNTRMHEDYFYEYLPRYSALYVRYRRGSEQFNCPNKVAFFDEVLERIYEFDVTRLIIDVRGLSGHFHHFARFMDAVNANERLTKSGGVYIITMPSSFSGGALAASVLRDGIRNALVIGEPTGSNINFAGVQVRHTMPNSGVDFFCADRFYFSRWNDETGPLMPDVLIPFTIRDLQNNIDPQLDFALSRGRFGLQD